MGTPGSFSVRIADWKTDGDALRAVRESVFVREQSVPESMEWDEFDSTCLHVVAETTAEAIGTGRLLQDGHIGRMAVLAPWRGRGVGSALLQSLLQAAAEAGHRRVMLSAQLHALDFYTRFGFAAEGLPYQEAGIEHMAMGRDLAFLRKLPLPR